MPKTAICILPVAGSRTEKSAPLDPDVSGFEEIDFNRAARNQYGAGAKAVKVGSHLYDWRARSKGVHHALDLGKAVREQFGAKYAPVALGLKASDWRALDLLAARAAILPVLIIAADFLKDRGAVDKAIKRYAATLERTRTWYAKFVGKSFRPTATIVVLSGRKAKDWNELSARTANEDDRYILWDEARLACESVGIRPAANWIAAVSVFTGASADVHLGAAGTPTWVVTPPRGNSVNCPLTGPLDARCADAVYALGHELGHAFGLGHTCEDFPGANCGASIMQWGQPPEAILVPGEIGKVARSPYFK